MWNQFKTILLLGVLSAVFVAIGGFFGQGGLVIFAALAVVMNLGAWFFSDRMVLWMHGGIELTPQQAPRLFQMTEELAVNAGIPMPRLYLIPADYANAFATGRNPSKGVVAVTEGLLRILSERQLRGVIAHEIAHIRNRDILIASIAATIATAISYVASALQWGMLLGFGGSSSDDEDAPNPLAMLALAIVAPIAGTLIQLGISRSREYLADSTAADITGDPEALASALEQLHYASGEIPAQINPATASLHIVNPLSLGGIASWFSTHPPVEDRIRLLREMAFTRPTITNRWNDHRDHFGSLAS